MLAPRSRYSFFSRAALVLFVALFCGSELRADEPTVTAVLDSSETTVDQPVQLQIKVTGARNATRPNEIPVDGLDIRFTGQSQLIEGRNFQFTSSVVYSYTIMPLRAGTFKIPPQTIRVGGTSLRTPELTLNVSDASTRSSRSAGRQGAPVDQTKIGFVQLIMSKTNAYVGEMIPAEVRLGFYSRTPVESLGNGVEISGQGFTTQKMREPKQTIETIGGRSYTVFTFKTAIAAARSGKIDIGPVIVNPMVRVPQTARNRSMPRDPFNMSDPFFDNFFNDPLLVPSVSQELTLKSDAVTLEVKPLPPKAPENFSGAIGIFSMTAEAKPLSVQLGDPITVTAKISGRGNFGRVNAPALEDENGWHKYPPSMQFKEDDDVGISGTKTFETVLSPNVKKDNIPPLIFSYFDPIKEQYETLRSDAIPVRVQGGSAPVATATPTATPASSTPTAVVKTAPKPQDILYQLTELPARAESFQPLFARRTFWLAQIIPLLALVGFFGWKIRSARLANRDARKIAALEQEAAELQRKLRRDETGPREYFANASRVVQLKTALAKNLNPNSVDAESAAKAFQVDEEKRQQLRHLFAQNDELRYSGGGNGSSVILPQERREVLELLESLR